MLQGRCPLKFGDLCWPQASRERHTAVAQGESLRAGRRENETGELDTEQRRSEGRLQKCEPDICH